MKPKAKPFEFEEDARPPRTEVLPVSEIVEDARLQPREMLSPTLVSEYTDLMIEGVAFPPLVVVLHKEQYFLVDGYHRLAAAKLASVATLQCQVQIGDLRSAILLSAKANASHGLRRSIADRRRSSVIKLLTDPEWTLWADREVARRCHVSHPFVAQTRRQLGCDVTGNIASERTYVTKHSTVSSMRITGLKRDATTAPISSAVIRPVAQATAASATSLILDSRADFIAALKEMERTEAKLAPASTIRLDPASDAELAGRMQKLARKLAARADLLATT